MQRTFFNIFAVTFCLGINGAFANDVNYYDMSLKELLDIKITGVSLREQDIENISASVNTFSAQSIRILGVNTLEELVRFVPGFQSFRSDDGNIVTKVARGKLAGSSSREFLLVIDGVRMDNWFDGGTAILGRIPLHNVQRVEFIRGPVSHIYGANAFLGVINIVTHRPGNKMEFGLGSTESGRFAVNYSFPNAGSEKNKGSTANVQQNFAMEVYSDAGDAYTVIDPFNAQQRVEVEDQNYSSMWQYRLKANAWELHTSYNQYDTEGFYSVGGFNSDFSSLDFDEAAINLKHDKQWSRRLRTDVSAGYLYYKNSRDVPILGEGALAGMSDPASSEPFNVILKFQGKGTWIKANTLFEANSNWIYQAGYEYRLNSIENAFVHNNYDLAQLAQNNFPVEYYGDYENTSPVLQGAEENIQGLYGMATYKNARYQLAAALRNDHSDLSGGNLSPGVSALYFVNEANTLKFVYGEAFRTPAANELFLTNNPLVNGNPNLQAETVETSEVIWLYNHNEQRVQLSLFENRFDHIISQTNPDGSRIFANLGKDTNRGTELTFVYPLTQTWVFRTIYTKVFELTEDAFRLADTSANVMLNYNGQAWTFVADYEYVSERSYVETGSLEILPIDAYGVLNVHLAHQLSSDLRVSLVGNNILGKDYGAPGAGRSRQAIPARGQVFTLNLEWSL